MNFIFLTLLFVSFTLAFWLTFLIKKLAEKHGIIDIPNHRSAHKTPIPRGGGLAIVLSVSVSLVVLWHSGNLLAHQFIALIGAGSLVAIAGFLDDKFSLSPINRLIIQFVAAGWGLFWLGGFPQIHLGLFRIDNLIALNVIGIFFLVWLTNLYNFMDGINGIAGLQAVSVCLFMSLVYYLATGSIAPLPVLIALASAGFLYWNFPNAKIFMGDVGSGYLGLIIGLISIQQAYESPQLLFSSLILMGVFVVDSSYTLVSRAIQGKKIYQAHSSHAYQHLARKKSHTQVSLGVLAVNSIWLLPISVLVIKGYLPPILGLILAYAPLLVIIIKSLAGRDASENMESRL
jgi:Fuc2NAc and GlcNAc transferase